MDGVIKQLMAGGCSVAEACAELAGEQIAALVAQLKAEADRHWWINARRSLELADVIITLGQLRDEPQHLALGLMARGDALKLLGRVEEAWEALGAAGDRFHEIGDDVGWARTRIGRLLICVDLRQVDTALADADIARRHLSAAGMTEKCLVLDMNTAIVHHLLGAYDRSLDLYQAALALGEANPTIGAAWLGPIHTNIGYVYDLLGDFRQALAHYRQARAHFAQRQEAGGVALVDLNSAHIAMAQGHYREALQLLHEARSFYLSENLASEVAQVDSDRVECYILLNRFGEARDLARDVCRQYLASGSAYREALALAQLATVEAQLGDYHAADEALGAAEAIFVGLGATTWVATVQLRRARIAYQRGELDMAEDEARSAAESFEASGRQIDHAEARLLHGQVLLEQGDIAAAAEAGAYALGLARRCNVPHLRYSAHLHNGRVAAALGQTTRAGRAFQAAVATVARAEQGLSLTLRPGFLENRSEALHALMGYYLQDGYVARAFNLLEHVKSHAMLHYIANRDYLRWPTGDTRARQLSAELDQLRAEHHWLYQRTYGQPTAHDAPQRAIPVAQLQANLNVIERRMRGLTEQLYLLSAAGERGGIRRPPAVHDLQRQLGEGDLLVEFYSNGDQIWAFTLGQGDLQAAGLAIRHAEVEGAIAQLELNIQAALRVGAQAPLSQRLGGIARQILARLFSGLLGPLAERIGAAQRLLIVPYGILHYVPFHLAHDGSGHLIERREVVILPTGSLLSRPAVRQQAGALVLAHTADGQLPAAGDEASSVQRWFGGAIYRDEAATRSVLQAPTAQVLHIAAHGKQRIDQPDLSYINLADGQLYADDLLQHDLSYELVTLSGCETGRATVAAGDELIGLGRGLLYAGAGALIASLWRVPDEMTATLMDQLYQSLSNGASKAAALRAAQRALLAQHPNLHPAFWGGFQ
ncbi:MAG: CHAT domain-containing protein, partial [Oscillochloris sp.]|nr:CHAT domain-containing protein [Oscillochloris sp.]